MEFSTDSTIFHIFRDVIGDIYIIYIHIFNYRYTCFLDIFVEDRMEVRNIATPLYTGDFMDQNPLKNTKNEDWPGQRWQRNISGFEYVCVMGYTIHIYIHMVVGLEHFLFFRILRRIIATD